MNKDKVQNQNILGTLVNKDESGIIAYSDQIYDKKANKSLEEENAKQNERLDNAEAKDREFQTTLDNITKTGEASAASNVTYNHNDSKLDATNVQQAIDEVRKRSNYNDGDEVIDFNTINIIKDNPTWLFLLVDTNDKFIYGITRKDGQPHWGVGIPKVVKDYVDKQINDILGTNNITETIDSLKEVENFLADFKNSDTLKALLNTKANKTDVDTAIANTNADIVDKYKKSNPNDEKGNITDTRDILKLESNNKFILMLIDSFGKVLDAVGKNGVRKIFTDLNIKGAMHLVTNNPRFIFMLTDSKDKFIFGIDKKLGTPIYGVKIPTQIKEYVDASVKDLSVSLDSFSSEYKGLLDNINIVASKGNILFTDKSRKVLFVLGLNEENKSFLPLNIQGSLFKVVNNKNFLFLLMDNKERPIIWLNKEGRIDWSNGVPKPIQDYVKGKTDGIRVYDSNDVVERNKSRVPALYSACRVNTGYGSSNGFSKDLQIEIITDTHEYYQSLQHGVKLANAIDSIDALVYCGDFVGTSAGRELDFVKARIEDLKKSSKPFFIAVGNHDCGTTPTIASSLTHKSIHDIFIKPIHDLHYITDDEYVKDKCWYYHDFKDNKLNQKIRMIFLYEFDTPLDVKENNEYWEPVDYDSSYPLMVGKKYVYDANSPTIVNCGDYKLKSFMLKKSVDTTKYFREAWSDYDKVPNYKVIRYNMQVGEEQMKWFLNVLKTTPKDYGIVLAYHFPFTQNFEVQTQYDFCYSDWNKFGTLIPPIDMNDIIPDIINAYQNRTSLNENVVAKGASSFENTNTDNLGNKYWYNVNVDFSDAKGNFICYIGGHIHLDIIMKHKIYNQYGIYPISGRIDRWSESEVSKYNKDELAYDAITTLALNSDRLALARLGNTYSTTGKKMDLELLDINK